MIYTKPPLSIREQEIPCPEAANGCTHWSECESLNPVVFEPKFICFHGRSDAGIGSVSVITNTMRSKTGMTTITCYKSESKTGNEYPFEQMYFLIKVFAYSGAEGLILTSCIIVFKSTGNEN